MPNSLSISWQALPSEPRRCKFEFSPLIGLSETTFQSSRTTAHGPEARAPNSLASLQ